VLRRPLRSRRHHAPPLKVLDLAGLVDATVWLLVALLLLHLFAPGDPNRPGFLRLPAVTSGVPLRARGPIVDVAADGSLRMDGAWLDGDGAPSELQSRLTGVRQAESSVRAELRRRGIEPDPVDSVVIVRADAHVDAAVVLSVIAAAAAAGWPDVSLLCSAP
jgi:biopolymer transport protein ExbD